jgi:4-amino-4-deoxy-L-arabinose transferase-like glycosyltransferase/tetratricopeptide (TPR) repeat protein
LVRVAFLLLLACLLWLIFYRLYVDDLEPFHYNPDVMAYAQIAEQLAEGNGLSTYHTYPYLTRLFPQKLPIPFPEVSWRLPLHPMLLALLFKWFQTSTAVIPFASGLAYVLTVPLVYLLATDMRDERIGILSGLLFSTNVFVLQLGVSGMSESLYSLLLLLFVWFATRRDTGGNSLAAGLFFGLSWLTRGTSQLLLIPALLYFLSERQGRRVLHLGLWLAAMTAVLLPYEIWRRRIIGDFPMPGVLHGIARGKVYREWHTYRMVQDDPSIKRGVDFVRAYPLAFLERVGEGLWYSVRNLPWLAGTPILTLLHVAALVTKRSNARLIRLQLFVLASAAITFAYTLVAILPIPRYFVVFTPLVVILAADLLVTAAGRMSQVLKLDSNALLSVTIGFLIIPPLILGIVRWRPASQPEPLYAGLGEFLQENISPDRAIVTNVPWTTGWYGKRLSLWYPYRPEDVYRLEAHIPVVLLLAEGDAFGNGPRGIVTDLGDKENYIRIDPIWKEVVQHSQASLPGFWQVNEFDNGRLHAVLLKRRPMGEIGDEYLARGDLNKAEAAYRDAVDQDPGNRLDRFNLLKVQGDIAQARSETDRALHAYRRAVNSLNVDRWTESAPVRKSAERLVHDLIKDADQFLGMGHAQVHLDVFVIGGELKVVLYQHPPMSVSYRLFVPPEARLRTSLALQPQAWHSGKGDGVQFDVLLQDASGLHHLFSEYIDPKNDPVERKWHDREIDLSAWGGQTVDVRFETGPGPEGDDQFDWAGWGEPRIVQPAYYSFLEHLAGAGTSEASLAYVRQDYMAINDDLRPVLFEHPPGSVSFPGVTILPNTWMHFGTGIDPVVWDEASGDGVEFRINLWDSPWHAIEVYRRYLDPHNQAGDRAWIDEQVDLNRFAGQTVDIQFVTGPGPGGSSDYDWAAWSNPLLVAAPPAEPAMGAEGP